MTQEILSQRPDPSVWGRFAGATMLPFWLPLMVFMIAGSFSPSNPDPKTGVEADNWFGLSFAAYPYTYAIGLAMGFLTLAACWRPIRSQFPFRWNWLSVAVGVVGVVLWVALCTLDLEGYLVRAAGEDNVVIKLLGLGPRPAFNPFEQLKQSSPALLWGFMLVRFIGLAVFVPIAEELMLRGWLMRHLETDGYKPHFWQVPFGQVGATTIAIGTAFPMLYHPEKVASLVWFTMVTWLMIRTRNFWDCVIAHAVTNFLLGVWVVTTGDWKLW